MNRENIRKIAKKVYDETFKNTPLDINEKVWISAFEAGYISKSLKESSETVTVRANVSFNVEMEKHLFLIKKELSMRLMEYIFKEHLDEVLTYEISKEGELPDPMVKRIELIMKIKKNENGK